MNGEKSAEELQQEIAELTDRVRGLQSVIDHSRIYSLDDMIEQFMVLGRQHMKRIAMEMQAAEYDPANAVHARQLINYLEHLRMEVEQHLYMNCDTLQRLDIPRTFWKGRMYNMKTISFINFKGGVGKTTVSINVAYAIHHSIEDVKILFIDNDKQGNASKWFDADLDRGTITNLMMGDATAKEIIQHTRYHNIDIIPADIGLIEANSALIKSEDINQATILQEALKDISGQYQLCIVDNPPDINVSVLNSLAFTDDVVIVTFPDPDSLSGVYQMVEQIDMVRAINPGLKIRGILINAFTSDDSVFRCIDELEAKNLPVFRTKIHYATKAAKKNLNLARRDRKSIFEQFPNCLVARDIWKFTKELLGLDD